MGAEVPDEIDFAIESSADVVLSNHRMVRDGDEWRCTHCPRTHPFPGGIPAPGATDPCIPRRWLDRS
jgi:hypothetical protein